MNAEAAKKHIALLSNVTADLLAARLRGNYTFYLPEGYDAWIQETLNPESGLYREKADAVILLLDGTEARSWKDEGQARERLALWRQGAEALCARMREIPVFLTTLDLRENRIFSYAETGYARALAAEWDAFIRTQMERQPNVYRIDLADRIADLGRSRFYADKMWYLSSMPYSRDGLALAAREIDRALRAAFTPRKKLIALDLDNTLWGGVIGEDGVDGIELSDHKEGQRYYDFQRQLLEMKKRGVVLALNSKNNPADAEEAIQKHPAMLLRDEDFALRKINWDNKAANLKAISRELNLTMGGIVFVDDNPVERAVVSGECPEALVPDFPGDTSTLLSFAEELWFDFFRPLRVLQEDLEKTRMYQQEALRRQEESQSLNLDDYISRLEMRADIHRMRPEELDRAAQLLGKTNQFNLTTRRYSKAELSALAACPENRVYVARSGDKYGENGLIALMILIPEGEDMRIDSFLMSCRVMGRKLEDVFVSRVAESLPPTGRLIGDFFPTAKNVPVRELYDRLGFRLLREEEGRKRYVLPLDSLEKQDFSMYKEIVFEA